MSLFIALCTERLWKEPKEIGPSPRPLQIYRDFPEGYYRLSVTFLVPCDTLTGHYLCVFMLSIKQRIGLSSHDSKRLSGPNGWF